MNNVFILFDGIGDGEFIISVHKTLDDAKIAGDEYLKEPTHKYVGIEEWEFDNPGGASYWDKGSYVNNQKHSFDWRKV